MAAAGEPPDQPGDAITASERKAAGLPRREFLRSGLGAAGAAVLGPGIDPAAAAESQPNLPPNVPEWTRSLGDGVASRPYGVPSRFENGVIRRTVSWLTPTDTTAVSFAPLQDLYGVVTPSGLAFERYHAGAPTIDPAAHRLMIHGLVERPRLLTVADVMRFPSVTRTAFIECAANGSTEWRGAQMPGLQFTHGMLSCSEWTGVALSTLLNEVGVKAGAEWILAEGADAAAMSRSVPLAKALDDALVVYAQNGERLRPEQGYPLRLLLPGWEGNINVKWLRRLKLGDQPWNGREETDRYTDLMPDGLARQFTWVMEAKSVITFPCPEKPLAAPGSYEVSGLAWSGNGKISRVDVSFDGGNNWRSASLQAPVQSKCLTRFRIDWHWPGTGALLQSRAIDETGYVQPTITQLRAVRGVNSIYHNNAIQTWRVSPSGQVENVQLA